MNPHYDKRLLLGAPLQCRSPALFLDRDGVVIEDRHHLSDPSQVALCPGAQPLIAAARRAGWPVVVVTNQSGIARDFFDWQAYERVSARMRELLGPGAPLAAIYANGWGPDAPAASWRKPNPGMLLDAAQRLHLDLARSLLIGDRLSDLQAGVSAGLLTVGHVLSGHGAEERAAVHRWAGDREWRPNLLLLASLVDFPLELLRPSPLPLP